jgi:sec-independent protein translocase protein TatA
VNFPYFAGPFGIGMSELLVIAAIVVVLFGANKLPQIGEGVGKMITNFRKSVKGEDSRSQGAADNQPNPQNKIPGA